MSELKKTTFTKVPLGTTIQNKLISRCDVAEGTKGRVVPIFQDVIGISCFFTETPKGVWLCSPEEALSVGVNPSFYYILPVFRLNTDAKATPLDTSLKLEYLRLGHSQYDELASALQEQEETPSFIVKKVKKGEYSYITPVASAKPLSDDLQEKVTEMRKALNEDQVFNFAIADIARPFKSYLQAIGPEAAKALSGEEDEEEERPTRPSIPASIPASSLPSSASSTSLEEEDEFDEDEEE